MNELAYEILIMPGLGDSGPQHWQYHWLKSFPNTTKLIQNDWDQPQLNDWLNSMHQTITSINKPMLLVAHSLAVSLALHYLQLHQNPLIKGVMLVAPADIDSPSHTPPETHNFAPMPLSKLGIPSVVVASENDPYLDFNKALYYAEKWGSQFYNMGLLGHINSASNLGNWEEGQNILLDLIKRI